MMLKITWSVKTLLHRLSMGDAHSHRLWALAVTLMEADCGSKYRNQFYIDTWRNEAQLIVTSSICSCNSAHWDLHSCKMKKTVDVFKHSRYTFWPAKEFIIEVLLFVYKRKPFGFWQFVNTCHLPNHGKRKVAAHKLKLGKWKIHWCKIWLTGKIWHFHRFHGNIRSLDFPIKLHTAYYN